MLTNLSDAFIGQSSQLGSHVAVGSTRYVYLRRAVKIVCPT